MRKLLIISLILFGLSPLVKGQMLNLNYQMSVPLGKMNDYAGKMSFRGMDLEYHHFLNEKFSIGGMIGWNTFYKDKGKLTGDFLFKGSKDIHTITGYQYSYINTVPIMVMGRYWLTDQNTMFRPYLGLGLGTSWTELKTDLGQFTDREVLHGFHFSGFGSVGVFSPDVECKLVVDGDNGTYFGCESELPSCVRGSELSHIGF